MIDLNDAAPARQHYDRDGLIDRLRDTAGQWAPTLFPQARRVDGVLRMGGIDGRPPRKQGSCVVQLAGANAGSWFDHDGGEGGGPLDTVARATGTDGVELFERAAELCGFDARSGRSAPRQAWKRDAAGPPAVDAKRAEVDFILEACRPSAGTLIDTYFASRGLPAPACEDLLFNPDLTHYDAKRGFPAMVALVRDGMGALLPGIHRTYLADDGTGKAPVAKQKMMLGSVGGGAVRLAPIGEDGHLGAAEGIETASAAKALFGVPAWAALSAGGLEAFPIPPGCRHLTVFADAGAAGQAAAAVLVERARQAGLEADVVSPLHGDDFADDLARGAARADYQARAQAHAEPCAPALVPAGGIPPMDYAGLIALADTLTRDASPALITEAISHLAVARLDQVPTRRVLDRIKARTGLPIATLESACKAARKAVPRASRGGLDWTQQLLVTENGDPKPCAHNVLIALRNAPEWAGVIWWNEMNSKVMIRRAPPFDDTITADCQWEDKHDVLAASWIQQHGIMANPMMVREVVSTVAADCVYHPVRDYLDGLAWDGVTRLDAWLLQYLGAEDTAYHRAVGAAWCISAVARAFRPGCKVDCALILEGAQALKKSTVAKIMGGDWFSDNLADMGSLESMMQMRDSWIIELAELDGMRRADINRIKAFMSRSKDKFRPPYGRSVVDSPRQCVFIGTVNPNGVGYIKDDTGGRRFWPVECGAVMPLLTVDADGLALVRDQLWAEATARFRAGEQWWLTAEVENLAKAEQELRQEEGHPWLAKIQEYTRWMDRVVVAEVMKDCLSIETSKMDSSGQQHVARCLKKLGFVVKVEKIGRASTRVWRRE